MHSVRAKPLSYRKSLGKVRRKWLCSAGCRSLRKDVQEFLQVSTASVVYDTWHHTAGHSGETGVLFLWHADDSVLADIWTPHLYLLHSRRLLCTYYLVHYPSLESSQQLREHVLQLSAPSNTVFVWISSLSQTRLVSAFAGEILGPCCFEILTFFFILALAIN